MGGKERTTLQEGQGGLLRLSEGREGLLCSTSSARTSNQEREKEREGGN